MGSNKRTTNTHLPKRVHIKHGAYYYVTMVNKWVRLGKTLPEAMQKWSEIVEEPNDIFTTEQLIDRYLLEIAPTKAKASYKSNLKEAKFLKQVFGTMKPSSITKQYIYKYLDERENAKGEKAPVAANREIALLSSIFTKAIRWGIVNDNPCLGVERNKETSRDRYVSHEEFLAVRSVASPPMIKHIMSIAYLTGLRLTDILKMKLDDIKEDGIHVEIQKVKNKTGIKVIFQWNKNLKDTIDDARALYYRSTKEPYLFCNTKGKQYTMDGFGTIWSKIIDKALQQELIQERFVFRDLRRKAASDLEEVYGREAARKLLGHSTQSTTKKYISGVQKIKTLDVDFLDKNK